MPRDTSFDTISYDLLVRFVHVESVISGLGSGVATHDGVTVAAYPHMGLPMPQEPFPAIYNFISGLQPDYSLGSTVRKDVYTITSRIIGGPNSPTYKVNPEDAANKLITAFINEFDWRPFLQDPTDSDSPFQYLAPDAMRQRSVGRTTSFNYSDLGYFVGIEINSVVSLQFKMGRIG